MCKLQKRNSVIIFTFQVLLMMIYSNDLKLLSTTDPNIDSCQEFEKTILTKF